MRLLNKLVFGLLLSACFLASAGAEAQVLTVRAGDKPLETIEIARSINPDGTLVTVYEVPANRRLVVTDLLITGGYCGHRINRGGVPFLVAASDGGWFTG